MRPLGRVGTLGDSRYMNESWNGNNIMEIFYPMDLISLSNLVTSAGQWHLLFAKSDDQSLLTASTFWFPVNVELVILVKFWYYLVFCWSGMGLRSTLKNWLQRLLGNGPRVTRSSSNAPIHTYPVLPEETDVVEEEKRPLLCNKFLTRDTLLIDYLDKSGNRSSRTVRTDEVY